MRRRYSLMCLAAMSLGLVGCADGEDATEEVMEEVVLGPKDGHDLGPIDLDRVQVGDMAPDFSLASLAGPTVTLSDFRSDKNIILVFYRGHW